MKQSPEHYQPKDSYVRVATACPEVSVGDVATNIDRISTLYAEAAAKDVSLLTFPELSVTGYTLGDLVQQTPLLEQAKHGLAELAVKTREMPTAMVVGLPLQVNNRLYNCAALLADGHVQGIVPKTHLPTHHEFYERRWYDSWGEPNTTVQLGEEAVPFGTNLLFEVGGAQCGIEICEDLWVSSPPSIALAAKGALVIANPSASPEQVGKATRRRGLVSEHSAKVMGAYLYAGCAASESTSDVVMGGHQLVAGNGSLLAEKQPFVGSTLTVTDVDIDRLRFERRSQHFATMVGAQVIRTEVVRQQEDLLATVERNPFLPQESVAARHERLDMALEIQSQGLAMRLRANNQDSLVLGLSGGLDSTLALIVAYKAAQILQKHPYDMIQTLTMPGPASSEGTQKTAQQLAEALGVQNTVIPIHKLVAAELSLLGHDGMTQDIMYENVQARARTSLLFNHANRSRSLVLGTNDLSEIAMGWCTYNGDQQSHYGVNVTVPKTLVRALVEYVATQPEYAVTKDSLDEVLCGIVSPELTKAEGNQISQSTEDIIGPYELHDFFLYQLVRWGDPPAKISYLAEKTFADTYQPVEIRKWLGVFIHRFVTSQFKRQNLPDGPKVTEISLSQRGDWRMPPDMHDAALWR